MLTVCHKITCVCVVVFFACVTWLSRDVYLQRGTDLRWYQWDWIPSSHVEPCTTRPRPPNLLALTDLLPWTNWYVPLHQPHIHHIAKNFIGRMARVVIKVEAPVIQTPKEVRCPFFTNAWKNCCGSLLAGCLHLQGFLRDCSEIMTVVFLISHSPPVTKWYPPFVPWGDTTRTWWRGKQKRGERKKRHPSLWRRRLVSGG